LASATSKCTPARQRSCTRANLKCTRMANNKRPRGSITCSTAKESLRALAKVRKAPTTRLETSASKDQLEKGRTSRLRHSSLRAVTPSAG
jgi:hypothetical protein